jgi:hypothetical protein
MSAKVQYGANWYRATVVPNLATYNEPDEISLQLEAFDPGKTTRFLTWHKAWGDHPAVGTKAEFQMKPAKPNKFKVEGIDEGHMFNYEFIGNGDKSPMANAVYVAPQVEAERRGLTPTPAQMPKTSPTAPQAPLQVAPVTESSGPEPDLHGYIREADINNRKALEEAVKYCQGPDGLPTMSSAGVIELYQQFYEAMNRKTMQLHGLSCEPQFPSTESLLVQWVRDQGYQDKDIVELLKGRGCKDRNDFLATHEVADLARLIWKELPSTGTA